MPRVAVHPPAANATWRSFYLTCSDCGPALVQHRIEAGEPAVIEHTCPACEQPVTQVEERA